MYLILNRLTTSNSFWQNVKITSSLYILCLSVCASVCLFVSNKLKNGLTNRSQFFVGPQMTSECLWMIKISKRLHQFHDFRISRKIFQNPRTFLLLWCCVQKENVRNWIRKPRNIYICTHKDGRNAWVKKANKKNSIKGQPVVFMNTRPIVGFSCFYVCVTQHSFHYDYSLSTPLVHLSSFL